MNKKDLPAMYSTAFWCLFVVLLAFLALLFNHCYSFTVTPYAALSLPSPRAFCAFLFSKRLFTTISEPGTGYFGVVEETCGDGITSTSDGFSRSLMHSVARTARIYLKLNTMRTPWCVMRADT